MDSGTIKTTIVYHALRQRFTEMDEAGNVIKQGSFTIPEKTETILENEKPTIVFSDDGSKGVALCHEEDFPVASFGRGLAYLRAKQVLTEKQIRAMLKKSHSKSHRAVL